MKKLVIALFLCLTTTIYAADTKVSALAENTTVADADLLYIVDGGVSKKITVVNLFDTIDTSLELLTILTNETGTGALVFAISPTFVTPILGTITSGVGTALTALNGENIQDDTIDDDSIDWADCTFADFDFETNWRMWHSNGAGDVTEMALGANGTFLESNGAAAAPAFRVLADGDVPDGITIDLATLATTLTITDNENTAENNPIVFVAGADPDGGSLGLETDGDFHYNPSTGTVTTTQFVGGGAGITGTLTAYDDIADSDAASLITFQDGETVTWATEEDSAGSFFLIQNSDAALAANTYLLDLDYSVDDNEANADYFRCQDAGGVVFSIQQDGDTVSTGTIGGTTITASTAHVAPLFDAAGAEDMDYGSVDVTDHTFITDGTGTAEIVLPAGSIDGTEILDDTIDSADYAAGSIDDEHVADDALQEPALNITNAGAVGVDNYLLSYNHAGTNFTWVTAGAGDMTKAVYDSGDSGGVDVLTTVDSTYAGDYVLLIGAAVGTNPPKTDGALTYDATSGTLSSTILTEGGLAVYNSGETPSGSLGGTYANITIDDLFIKLDGDVATAGDYDFGSANVDLELPQTSPAVPDVDGQVELDFTDGKMVIQHGSAHAELGASTDVVMGTLIRSFAGTIWTPDGINDVMTVKAINSIEFPHGVVITATYLGISEDSNYTLTVQNFDDFDTINGVNPTIDTVVYTADTTGEIIDTTPTYTTIAAGQIIMISIPATDVAWIHFEIYYYEPAA